LEQAELARRSGLSLETIKRLERIRGPVDANTRTLNAIVQALRLIGIEFETRHGVGVRFVGHDFAVAAMNDPPFGAPPAPLHRLIFFSTLDPQLAPRVKSILDAIREDSQRRNAALGVTGAMFVCEGHFLQVLEGGKCAVLQVYGAISADPRHHDLNLVEARPIQSRLFQDWSVCCGLFAADDEVLRREPAMAEGFCPEALTPASALGLLTVMRDLQRTNPRNLRASAGPCPLVGECLDQVCAPNAA